MDGNRYIHFRTTHFKISIHEKYSMNWRHNSIRKNFNEFVANHHFWFICDSASTNSSKWKKIQASLGHLKVASILVGQAEIISVNFLENLTHSHISRYMQPTTNCRQRKVFQRRLSNHWKEDEFRWSTSSKKNWLDHRLRKSNVIGQVSQVFEKPTISRSICSRIYWWEYLGGWYIRYVHFINQSHNFQNNLLT